MCLLLFRIGFDPAEALVAVDLLPMLMAAALFATGIVPANALYATQLICSVLTWGITIAIAACLFGPRLKASGEARNS
jgi:hypothetical protein